MSRRRSRPSPSVELPRPDSSHSPLAAWLSAAWLIGFCIYFLSSTLPNAQRLPDGSQLSRPNLLLLLLTTFPESLWTSAPIEKLPSGWKYLPQRVDLLAVAALLLAGAYCGGQLLLRMLRVPLLEQTAERRVFAAGLGLCAVSLLALVSGLAGGLLRSAFVAVLAAAILVEGVLRWRNRGEGRATRRSEEVPEDQPSWAFRILCLAGITPFVLAMLLGSMQPETDFDVREYHLEGPKEHFLAGRIGFLPHNVYTSFPFLTEMLSLAGMVVRGDWFRGALAGKVVLMSFAPLTGLAVYAAARRYFGAAAGWFAALIYLSTPWAYRIAIIAYAEGGLTFFLAASLLAALVTCDELRAGRPAGRFAMLTGLMAGSAMACKYPGVVSVVIPLGLALAAAAWRFARQEASDGSPVSAASPASPARPFRPVLITASLYSAGVLVAVGPWLLKNLVETGNPVYPLLYSIFGGRDWDAALDAKFRAAHRPDDYDLTRLWFWITDVSARNDWLSPLLYGFAPLAWFAKRENRTVTALWIYVGWLFATWWLLTHRLDRFWVPMLPVVAVLAGAGAASMSWRWLRGVVLAVCLLFNLQYVTSALAGPNNYLADLDAARKVMSSRAMASLNDSLPAGSKVLCVGEAQVFDATVRVVYNTVFDRSIFQDWFAAPEAGVADADLKLRDPAAIRETLRREGITHVFVNWSEILRYRATYGYSDFVAPRRFAELVRMGVLGKPKLVSVSYVESLSQRERTELEAWGPELRGRVAEPAVWTSAELYPVRNSAP